MPKVIRKYKIGEEETEFVFAPLSLGYMKEHRDLMKAVASKNGIDDLIEQSELVVQSLVRGGIDHKAASAKVEDLEIPDLTNALLAMMEASGYVFQNAPKAPAPGEEQPAK